ncbi:hypothetical protein GWK47_040242 [Chionoecetes opilio]|uniref:Uncharacterized protein n=1 Tax=Chionoecetes opilio TaxID=41210 RepID=A0A8J4YAV5_CHIOP|nr:hypothetical protein GWK47_040242 [Chionoecetes opilio]
MVGPGGSLKGCDGCPSPVVAQVRRMQPLESTVTLAIGRQVYAACGLLRSLDDGFDSCSLGTSDISLSDVELDSSQLFTQDIEESGTEQEDQRKRQEGTRQLKAMLWHLEKFFVFDSYVRTENDTLEGKSVHTGRARCQQKTCLSKGKAATYTYTTRSKVNLKKHYEKMHSAMLQCVRTAFDGASKRGCPKAREDELPAKRGGRQLCLEESFSRKDIVTPEVLRKTCTRWFIDTMMPLSLIDHPTTRHFFSLLAPEFSAPSRRTLGREIDQVSATAKSDLFSMLYDTSYVATN